MTAAATWLVLAACALAVLESRGASFAQPAPAAAGSERRALPPPRRSGGPALSTVLATRRSRRAFAGRDLEDSELGQLLWAAQGTSDGHRTSPSAGALYPITVWVIDGHGVWRYAPAEHAIVRRAAGDHRRQIAAASFGQDAVQAAPAVLAITAEFAITARKYGGRAERFATLEAGHVAQNVLLAATALGLAAVPVGAFDEATVRRTLGLPGGATPLYLIPVGPRP